MQYDVGSRRFDEFDAVILPYDAFVGEVKSGVVRTARRAERDRRDKEIAVLLERGGIVCWLLDRVPLVADGPDYRYESHARWVARHGERHLAAYPGFLHLYYLAGLALASPWSTPISTLRCSRPEFAAWVASESSTCHSLEVVDTGKADRATTVCRFAGGTRAGVAIPAGRGTVLVLPYLPASRPDQQVAASMEALALAVARYHQNASAAPPPWLGEFSFTGERKVREGIARLDEARAEQVGLLQPYDEDKKLLYLGDDQLTEQVVACLHNRGLKIQREEKFTEDFFLLDEDGNRVAICEVKGLDKNAKRGDVDQLGFHLSNYEELPDEFPGVLIANTFRKARSLADKDRQIEARTRKHAAARNVAILRTIDLLRLFDLMATRALTREQLLKLFTETQGWLRVDADGGRQVLQE